MRFPRLFSPIKLGQRELKNRIVMPALGLGYTRQGVVTEQLKAFYAERVRNGPGLIALNTTATNPGVPFYGSGIFDDKFIPGLHELVDVIHRGGSLAVAQLIAFPNWLPRGTDKVQYVGPSDVVLSRKEGARRPEPLSVEQIQQLTEEMVQAAARAREAGFDGIELHALAGESILSQFLSPITNKRTDEYGGSPENRMRLLLETVDKTRKRTGNDFLYLCRLSGEDFVDGGQKVADTALVARNLEKAGIHSIGLAIGFFTSSVPFIQMSVPEGAFVYLSAEVKKSVSVPVGTCVRITNPEHAESILAGGKADLIGMARALIADPDWVVKAQRGDASDIRECIACCHCFDSYHQGMTCAVNARVGREARYAATPRAKPMKVLVIGGGPAGMEAARAAAAIGHSVTLWEKQTRLGGQLSLASVPSGKRPINLFTGYLKGQLGRLGVRIELEREATAADVLSMDPDAVIVATGGIPAASTVPGSGGHNVFSAAEVLAGREVSGRSVIVLGGGLIGCETAEYLIEKKKHIVIVSRRDKIGNDFAAVNRWLVMKRLRDAGVRMETNATALAIETGGVRILQDGAERFIEGDAVVTAAGMNAEDALAKQLEDKVRKLRVIGDCVKPRRIYEAVDEGYRAAWDLGVADKEAS